MHPKDLQTLAASTALRAALRIPPTGDLLEHLRAMAAEHQRRRDAGELVAVEDAALLRIVNVTADSRGMLHPALILEAAEAVAWLRIACDVGRDWRAAAWWLEHTAKPAP